jgi:hypothetical protein
MRLGKFCGGACAYSRVDARSGCGAVDDAVAVRLNALVRLIFGAVEPPIFLDMFQAAVGVVTGAETKFDVASHEVSSCMLFTPWIGCVGILVLKTAPVSFVSAKRVRDRPEE